MCRKVHWTCAALVAGLLFSSAQAAAAAISSTNYSEQALHVKPSSAGINSFPRTSKELPQDAPSAQGATLAMASGALLILFGSIRRKDSRG